MGYANSGHTRECRVLLSRPPIRRQANLAFFRGERDLLMKGRGLEGDVALRRPQQTLLNSRVHYSMHERSFTRLWGASYADRELSQRHSWTALARLTLSTREGVMPNPQRCS